MPENVYLTKLREKYDGLRSSITGLQETATAANRTLTDDEKSSIKQMSDEGQKLYTEIESLTEVEVRNAQVRDMQARIAGTLSGADGSGNQSKAPATDVAVRTAGGATTKDRDPGHYRSEQQGGQHSFFRDLYGARERQDEAAARRLQEHNRALTTGAAGSGIVPPKWMVDEYAALARQGRVLANLVRNVPLGDDPRPLTLPKQTAGTDTEVVEQAAENDPIEDDDQFDTDVDTVTPKPTAGSQVVSRQMLDMASPAIDGLIYGDLIAAYNLKVEKKVGTAIVAVGTALPALSGVPVTDPAHFARVTLKAGVTVRSMRKLPANVAAMSVARWGEFLDLTDTTGRPLVTGAGDGPQNIAGMADLAGDGGRYKGLTMAPTEGIALDDRVVVLRASDVLLFESGMMRFRYEEPLGPESIKMGIWAYTAVLVRYGTAAIKRVEITEDDAS